ncbi:MAG: twin-arginine translocation signal domain-containing protein [Verrucomicrobiota bacterium]
MDFQKLSRRDFLKKTTVLAVGATSLTLFSGLAFASIPRGYQTYPKCGLKKTPGQFSVYIGNDPNATYIDIWNCEASGPVCIDTVECGEMNEYDPQLKDFKKDANGKRIKTAVVVDCWSDNGVDSEGLPKSTKMCLR